ncbi:MAG: sigma-70 family RNA polymerase sigma factor [Blastocatellia bacterium]
MITATPQQPTRPDVTGLLVAWRQGDQAALEQLTPLVFAELHQMAHAQMSRERGGHLLQTTALVNEAYLKLMNSSQVDWQNRAQFFALAATLMRRILVDIVRQRQFQKRGGAVVQVAFDEALAVPIKRPTDLVALDDALEDLAKLDARKSRVVELRFFGGLSIEETASVLDVSADTVKREWRAAKLWLRRELSNE